MTSLLVPKALGTLSKSAQPSPAGAGPTEARGSQALGVSHANSEYSSRAFPAGGASFGAFSRPLACPILAPWSPALRPPSLTGGSGRTGGLRPSVTETQGILRGPVAPEPEKRSSYWPDSKIRMSIEGHQFDFAKPRAGSKKGKIDGPWHHNGVYEILENTEHRFQIHIKIGTNSEQNNDADLMVTIHDKKAVIKGKTKGKPVEFTAPVTGQGTRGAPFQVNYTDANGKTDTFKWYQR